MQLIKEKVSGNLENFLSEFFTIHAASAKVHGSFSEFSRFFWWHAACSCPDTGPPPGSSERQDIMNFKSILGATAIAVGLLGAAQTGHAAIIVTEGASGTGNNVIFNSCAAAVMGPASTVSGCLNGQPTTRIDFTSNELLRVDAGGQARIEAADGSGYNFLRIDSILPATFSTLVLNIDTSANGTVTFTGSPGGTSTTFNLSQNGNNFFTITGENFDFVSFTTTGTLIDAIVVDTQQVRLDTTVTTVPEPASLALFGAGLLGLGMVRRRKQSV